MHAAGHALVALVAGALAVGLTGALSQPAGVAPAAPAAASGLHLLSIAHARDAFALSVVGLGAVLVKSLTGVYATYVQGRAAGELGARLRLDLLDALLSVHRLRRPRQDDQGDTSFAAQAVASLTERVHDVEAGLKQGFLGGLRALAHLVPLAVVMGFVAPAAALVACAILAVFGVALGRARRTYRRALVRAGAERTRLLEAADESVRHADLWVTYGAEAKARAALSSLGHAIAERAARLEARAAALSGGNEVLGALALVLAIGASRLGWFGAAADEGTLLAFAIAFFLAYRPLRELTEARLALERARAAFAGLEPVLHAARPSETDAPPVAPPAEVWPAAVLELRGLRLGKGRCGPLSLRVEPGSIVAIVGATGVGKTTLLRTLLGLEPAAGGDVLYAGAAVGQAPAGPMSRPFAWVPQDAPLLADTLEANVALGAAPEAAGAEEDLLAPLGGGHLRHALEGRRLGAGGRSVSGGERQWIALARAIATRQPVLLLDEPTSGLDAASQRLVLDAIAGLRGQRTVLLVTHRAEPLAVADVVVRLDAPSGDRAAA